MKEPTVETTYRCSDGVVYDTYQEALSHEHFLSLKILIGQTLEGIYESNAPDPVIEYVSSRIRAQSDDFIRVLLQFASDELHDEIRSNY